MTLNQASTTAARIFAGNLPSNHVGLRGPQIIEFFQQFNPKIEEYGSSPGSRKDIFKHCVLKLDNDSQRIAALLQLCEEHPSRKIEDSNDSYTHLHPKDTEVEELKIVLLRLQETCLLSTVPLEKLNREQLNENLRKLKKRFYDGEYDGAVTSGRSLVESMLKNCLNELGIGYNEWDNLKNLFNMWEDRAALVDLLSIGTKDIIRFIVQFRNEHGDSHGQASRTHQLSSDETAFFLDTCIAISSFLDARTNLRLAKRNTDAEQVLVDFQ